MANFSCPNNGAGTWYSCAGGSRFVGCCSQDPCLYGCLAGNLAAASFNTDIAGKIPNLECDQGAKFFACTNSGFWGCCKTDACVSTGGCQVANLRPATLVSDPSATAAYSPTGVPPSFSAPSSDSRSPTALGAIIGGTVGGSVGAILIAFLAYFLIKKRRKHNGNTAAETTEAGKSPETDYSGPAELMGESLRAEGKSVLFLASHFAHCGHYSTTKLFVWILVL